MFPEGSYFVLRTLRMNLRYCAFQALLLLILAFYYSQLEFNAVKFIVIIGVTAVAGRRNTKAVCVRAGVHACMCMRLRARKIDFSTCAYACACV